MMPFKRGHARNERRKYGGNVPVQHSYYDHFPHIIYIRRFFETYLLIYVFLCVCLRMVCSATLGSLTTLKAANGQGNDKINDSISKFGAIFFPELLPPSDSNGDFITVKSNFESYETAQKTTTKLPMEGNEQKLLSKYMLDPNLKGHLLSKPLLGPTKSLLQTEDYSFTSPFKFTSSFQTSTPKQKLASIKAFKHLNAIDLNAFPSFGLSSLNKQLKMNGTNDGGKPRERRTLGNQMPTRIGLSAAADEFTNGDSLKYLYQQLKITRPCNRTIEIPLLRRLLGEAAEQLEHNISTYKILRLSTLPTHLIQLDGSLFHS